MNKFEVGRKYRVGGIAYEIVKRTEKFVTYRPIQHEGRFNERRGEEKRTKIYFCDFGNTEVFFTGHNEVEAK